MVQVRYRRLRAAAITPRYMSDHAAGADLASAADGPLFLAPGARLAVPTGLALEIPAGYEGQVRPRSGLALRAGVTMLNTPGTIDADYRGEVSVPLINLGPADFVIERGMRIAQMVIMPVPAVELTEVDELDDTARGKGGFGHTGH